MKINITTQKAFRLFWILQLLFFSASYFVFATTEVDSPGYFFGVYAVLMYVAVVFARFYSQKHLEIKSLTIISLEVSFLVAMYSLFLSFQCGKCDDLSTQISVAFTLLLMLLVEVLISIIYLKYMERFVADNKLKIVLSIAPAGFLILATFLLDYFYSTNY